MTFKTNEDFLTEKKILITGCTSGIGRELAKGLAQYGATVILTGRNITELEACYDEIVNQGYPQPVIHPIDFIHADPATYTNMAHVIEKELSGLDILIHNAAILGKLAPLEHYDIKIWYEVMQVNLNAPFLLTRALLPLLQKSSEGAIVFTIAPEGEKGRAYWGSYGASKFALHGLMQILADELENTTIRVNAINPGKVNTPLRHKAYPAEDTELLATPESIISSYLYLLSDSARHVHGQCLNAQTGRIQDESCLKK